MYLLTLPHRGQAPPTFGPQLAVRPSPEQAAPTYGFSWSAGAGFARRRTGPSGNAPARRRSPASAVASALAAARPAPPVARDPARPGDHRSTPGSNHAAQSRWSLASLARL